MIQNYITISIRKTWIRHHSRTKKWFIIGVTTIKWHIYLPTTPSSRHHLFFCHLDHSEMEKNKDFFVWNGSSNRCMKSSLIARFIWSLTKKSCITSQFSKLWEIGWNKQNYLKHLPNSSNQLWKCQPPNIIEIFKDFSTLCTNGWQQ